MYWKTKHTSNSNLYKRVNDTKTFDKVRFASDITNSKCYILENLEKQLDLKTKMEELLKFIDTSNLENH